MISFAATTKLICVFVFAYAKSQFSHDAAQITWTFSVVLFGRPGTPSELSRNTLYLLSTRLCFLIVLKRDLFDTVMILWRGRGLSYETNNQINVVYHFKNLGWGCARKTSLSPPVNHYSPFQGGSFVVVLCCLFFVSMPFGEVSPCACSYY